MLLQGVLLLVVLSLLVSSVLVYAKVEKENYFWVKIVVFFLLSLLTLNLGSIPIPLGFLAGLWFVSYKAKGNIPIKRLALVFGVAGFVMTQIIPAVSFEELQSIQKIQQWSSRFEHIYAVHDYEPTSPIQKKISGFVEDRTDVDAGIAMMRTWVLQQKNEKIKSRKWLLSDAADELAFWWHSSRRDEFRKTYEFIEFKGGKGYFGVFKQDQNNEQYYLDFLIEFDHFKNARPTLMGTSW
ncbi:MAG TPA: hypothetical protein VFT51_14320 [Bacillales bacterium]|nr:hypothetical protein [Bacillales bacterium]